MGKERQLLSLEIGRGAGWFKKSSDLLLRYCSLFTTTVSVGELFSIVYSLKLTYEHLKTKTNFPFFLAFHPQLPPPAIISAVAHA